MIGLRALSYTFIAAGAVTVVLVGLNALGLDLRGEPEVGYVEPGTAPSSKHP